MKKLILLLLLYSPFTYAEYILVTACGSPIVVIFQDDEEVKVIPVLGLKHDDELREKFTNALNHEKGFVIKAETQYPIICPHSS